MHISIHKIFNHCLYKYINTKVKRNEIDCIQWKGSFLKTNSTRCAALRWLSLVPREASWIEKRDAKNYRVRCELSPLRSACLYYGVSWESFCFSPKLAPPRSGLKSAVSASPSTKGSKSFWSHIRISIHVQFHETILVSKFIHLQFEFFINISWNRRWIDIWMQLQNFFQPIVTISLPSFPPLLSTASTVRRQKRRRSTKHELHHFICTKLIMSILTIEGAPKDFFFCSRNC